MGKPAARVGDGHACPMVTPGTGMPHLGGPVTGPGCTTVLIENLPAATAGDLCTCAGAVDKITDGSTGVFIGGKPAARLGDPCMHGGVVTGGSGLVLIGESMGRNFLWLPCVWEEDGEHLEPAKEEKIAIVKKVILDCIGLLENRLKELVGDDPETIRRFEQWFGCYNEERKLVIVERIERQVVFFKELGMNYFSRIAYEIDYRNLLAMVYPWDVESSTIFLGHPFWSDRLFTIDSRATVLIHEVSHFENLGRTMDHEYDERCEDLAKSCPEAALYNADSYAFFITRD
ncbi:PAAR domain-containing protein [Niastella populi]|uniref:Lysine-specific metallo-endopeptidase domain-containing protein n=1 Tax=Niastella populi TaxID=550983 RepID=A0A1V9GB00_9BACT|nr:M35 family metallo-endopeptidase [Niastella populi]OQP67616.1 hypothetical protein A4R26_12450 [Niastella populi]